jgi:hypothetical protein
MSFLVIKEGRTMRSFDDIYRNNNNELDDLGELGKLVRQCRETLRDDGPPVDAAALYAFIDGDLTGSEFAEVKHRIQTFRTWNHEYWEIRADIELAKNAPSTKTGCLAQTDGVSYRAGWSEIYALACRGGRILIDDMDF